MESVLAPFPFYEHLLVPQSWMGLTAPEEKEMRMFGLKNSQKSPQQNPAKAAKSRQGRKGPGLGGRGHKAAILGTGPGNARGKARGKVTAHGPLPPIRAR